MEPIPCHIASSICIPQSVVNCQRVALAYLRQHEQMTNSDYQRLNHVDSVTATRELRGLAQLRSSDRQSGPGGRSVLTRGLMLRLLPLARAAPTSSSRAVTHSAGDGPDPCRTRLGSALDSSPFSFLSCLSSARLNLCAAAASPAVTARRNWMCAMASAFASAKAEASPHQVEVLPKTPHQFVEGQPLLDPQQALGVNPVLESI